MNRIEKTVLDLIETLGLNHDSRILELSPGEGSLSRALKDRFQIEAMDIHPENFHVPGVRCHQGDLSQRFPFPDRSFDLLISVEGIEHLEHQYNFASEVSRVLKDSGAAIITTPNIANFASRLRFLFTGFYSLAERPSSEFEKDWIIEHIYPITFWQLRHILHTRGLIIERITTDKIRRSAVLGLTLFPLCYVATWLSVRKEGDDRQRGRNFEILKQMHSPALFLGRTQIVLTRKQQVNYVGT